MFSSQSVYFFQCKSNISLGCSSLRELWNLQQVTVLKKGAISGCHQQGALISCQSTGSLDIKKDDFSDCLRLIDCGLGYGV